MTTHPPTGDAGWALFAWTAVTWTAVGFWLGYRCGRRSR